MRRRDLADLNSFVAVADHSSFRAASTQLGVTASALSHSLRQLEERLGTRLLHRTTRSVSLTDAGLRLLEHLRPAIDQISGALEALNQQRAGRNKRSALRRPTDTEPVASCCGMAQ
jgi:DNA-binding transcriptional LysR family regulator